MGFQTVPNEITNFTDSPSFGGPKRERTRKIGALSDDITLQSCSDQ